MASSEDIPREYLTHNDNDILGLLAQTPIENTIAPGDLETVLSISPFVVVPGTFNLRDVGGGNAIRPNVIYRSGTLSGLLPEGKDVLVSKLQIRTVFDLRSARERAAFPFPDSINGKNDDIEVLWCPSDTPPTDTDIKNFVDLPSESPESWSGGARGFSRDYLEVLRIFKTSFQRVFQHLLDRPNDAVLFNCTAGKDRTGTLAALIQALAGMADEDIARDYALSRIGMEPQKAYLTAFIKKWKPDWTPETPGMRGFSNVRAEYMIRFLKDAKGTYPPNQRHSNWAAEYVYTQLGFSEDDIEKIRKNLRSAPAENGV
ncbi:hypothetical protein LTR84_012837 [Exophiala bonariae]|uniref:Tyrosine specific protein phosphatases domain-containing protein n=1 Tax=Exophiala bonariae TaxID=1690606 RepID=A0AAV9NE35_9EURO|nr:hypothetical protein LTR84_012837 [Exophiala bonariae]